MQNLLLYREKIQFGDIAKRKLQDYSDCMEPNIIITDHPTPNIHQYSFNNTVTVSIGSEYWNKEVTLGGNATDAYYLAGGIAELIPILDPTSGRRQNSDTFVQYFQPENTYLDVSRYIVSNNTESDTFFDAIQNIKDIGINPIFISRNIDTHTRSWLDLTGIEYRIWERNQNSDYSC